ncbi:hypothetical protein GGP97_002392 [Salinibacter ruber]|nr:hypothetical protein [Salinibacter ruber]
MFTFMTFKIVILNIISMLGFYFHQLWSSGGGIFFLGNIVPILNSILLDCIIDLDDTTINNRFSK